MELEPILGNIEKSGMVNVDLGKIVRNLKTNQEVRWYCHTNSKLIFLIISMKICIVRLSNVMTQIFYFNMLLD